ncbi:MAG: FIST signal transduction protein [Thermodesulfobacteriota bacterium]
MKIGVAWSANSDSEQAGEKAAKAAVESSGSPIMTFLFITDAYDQRTVLEAVKNVVSGSKLAGFCCAGIITSHMVLKQGVGVCTVNSDTVQAATSLQGGLSRNPFIVGKNAGKELLANGIDEGTVFLFPDGFGANISETVRGLYNTMGPNFKYVGGGSGDNLRFFKTYQFTETNMMSDALAVAALKGITFETAIGHGWTPLGEPVFIGRTEGKKVIEIDGRPAFEAYKERFTDINIDNFSEYGMRYPLGFPDIWGNYLIRDPIKVNSDQSIDFVTEVPDNAVGYLMEGNVDHLLGTATNVAETICQKMEYPDFVLCMDCVSRYLLMGDEFESELAIIEETIGNVPILGALTFGEVGSYLDVPHFHNKTLVLASGGK